MSSHRSLLAGLLLLFAASASAQQGQPHTKVRLVADVSSVQPGSAFTLGIVMSMEEGWHTYWENPGEAGIPTAVAWKLPTGFAAGEIRWPVPHKYLEAGDILTYGYEKETMLLVPVTIDGSVRAGGSVTIEGEVTWLECERVCLPGSATVSLTLPVASGPALPAEGGLFARYRAMLPTPLADLPALAVSAEFKDRVVRVRFIADGPLSTAKGTEPDFYPGAVAGVTAGRTVARVSGSSAEFAVPMSTFETLSGDLPFAGVIVYALAEGGGRKAVRFASMLPASFLSTLTAETPVVGQSTQGGVLDRDFATVESAKDSTPLWMYLLFAFVGGLLLNIMPCVLPAISLKIFGLVRMSGDAPAQVKRHGLSFALGIFFSFMVLALLVILLKGAGEQVGWGFQFQEPLFVIAMAAVVFAFGLSLFGVFEAGLLFMLAFAGVGSALERKAREGKGYGASFWEGIFATILATPCTAPFLGSALGFAFSQPAVVTLLVFATVGVGMAVPYVMLTANPGWMKFLPKPGAWMETAKQFMGFLLMGTVVWLLSILGSQLGMEAVVWTCAFLVVVALGCWLVGRFATLNAPRRTFALTWLSALALVVAGYMVFIAPSVRAGRVLGQSSAIPADEGGIRWEPFSLQALDAALAEARPVFVDFTAEWCLTCKVNERTVLADREVVDAFSLNNVRAFKADWTNRNPEITKLLAKFGRSGVPLYVVFPAGKPDAPIVLPEVITGGIVIEALNRAAVPPQSLR